MSEEAQAKIEILTGQKSNLHKVIPELNFIESQIFQDFWVLSRSRDVGFSHSALKYRDMMFYFDRNYLEEPGLVTIWTEAMIELDEVFLDHGKKRSEEIEKV